MLPCHLIIHIVGVLYVTLLCATTISAVPSEAVTDPPTAVQYVEGTGQEPPLVIPAGAANYYLDPLASSSAETTATSHVPTTVPNEAAIVKSAKSAAVEVGTVSTYDTQQTITVVETNDETRIYLHDPTTFQLGMEPWKANLNSAGATTIHGASFGSFPTVLPIEVISEEPPASAIPAEDVIDSPTTALPVKITAQEQPAGAGAAYYLEPLASFPVESTATNPVPEIDQTEAVTVESAEAAIGEASVLAISTRIGEENVTVPPTVEVVGTLNINNNKTQTVTVVEMNDETRIYLHDPTSVQPGIEPWTTHLNSVGATSIDDEPSIPFPTIVPVETISEEPPAASIPVEAVIELPIVAVPIEVTAKDPLVVIPAEAISVEVPIEPSESAATNSVTVAEPVEAPIVDEVQPAVKAGTVDISFNKKPTVTVVEMNDETRIYVYDSTSVQPGMEPWKTNISWGVATIYGSYPVMVPTVAPVAVLSEESSPARQQTIPTEAAFVEPLAAVEPTVAAVSAEAAAVEPDDTKDTTILKGTDDGIKFSLQATLEMRTANKKKHTVKVIEKDDQTLIFVYDPKSIQMGMEPWRTFL